MLQLNPIATIIGLLILFVILTFLTATPTTVRRESWDERPHQSHFLRGGPVCQHFLAISPRMALREIHDASFHDNPLVSDTRATSTVPRAYPHARTSIRRQEPVVTKTVDSTKPMTISGCP